MTRGVTAQPARTLDLLVGRAEELESLDELLDELMQAGVGCGVYYPRLVYDYQCYKAHPQVIRGDVPVAERVVRQCLSLPVHAQLSSSDLDRIVTTVGRLLAA